MRTDGSITSPPPRDIPRQPVRLVPVIQLSLCDARILDVVVLDQVEQLLSVEGDWLFVPERLKNKATHVGKKGVRDGPVMMAMLFEFLPGESRGQLIAIVMAPSVIGRKPEMTAAPKVRTEDAKTGQRNLVPKCRPETLLWARDVGVDGCTAA